MLKTLRKFSFKRPISSYAKVQYAVSAVIRTKRLFISKKGINSSKLLNVGCGPYPHPDFINLDYHWNKDIDICWDITRKPYPLPSGSIEGIYTEHCLEHISFADFEKNMHEFYRLLAPGATVRIIMPDGELYLDIYERKKKGENVKMPYEEHYITPMARINGIFRNHGHKFIYDFETVKKLLEKAGFRDIRKETFGNGRDPRLLIDSEWRSDESLYVEASK
ncbi:MAG TPA: methyltransferase domain-containing protein [Chitinophagaceae bacterium]|nr:methyltransferase domain-containing protein [Chitinophagaceae bacterium]